MPAQTDPGYFFMPNHIILIGASEQPYSLGERVLSNLLSTPFQGKITPVNPRHHTIAGLPAYTSLNKIPGSADLIITVTPPDSYDTLLKTCRKKQLRHIILIQDWDSLSAAELHTAETAIRKHHGNGLNITAYTTAGIQLPSLGLNISTQDGYAAGHTAILTGNAAVSRQIDNILNKLRQGTSRHINLHPGISPITSADWLNRFGHSLHTKTAVLHHNPEEDQRRLFSAIRQFTRHTPLILHITCLTTETDRAVLPRPTLQLPHQFQRRRPRSRTERPTVRPSTPVPTRHPVRHACRMAARARTKKPHPPLSQPSPPHPQRTPDRHTHTLNLPRHRLTSACPPRHPSRPDHPRSLRTRGLQKNSTRPYPPVRTDRQTPARQQPLFRRHNTFRHPRTGNPHPFLP